MKKIKKGVTLLEVVIALAIIAIMVMPLMSSLLTSVSTNKKSEDIQEAKLISQKVVERLRVEDEIKDGKILLGDMELAFEKKLNSVGKNYFLVKSNEVKGFSLEGKIFEEDVQEMNNNTATETYKNQTLGMLVVVDSDGVYYSNNTYKDKSIEEIIGEEKNNLTNFKKLEKNGAEINIQFKNATSTDNGNKFDIYINDSKKVDETEEGVGIYIIEKNNFQFNFLNESNKTQNIYVFKNSNLSKEDGALEGQVKEVGSFNKFTNIIFDSNNKSKGLYTFKFDVKRKNEVIESIESQFYLKG